jgi:hypothetical protein
VLCHSYIPLCQRLPSHDAETELNNSLTNIAECLHFDKYASKQIAQNENCVLLETLFWRIKLDGPCHMTVHTDLPAQCAAVSTQFGEMRLPLQKDAPSLRMAA